MNVPVAMNLIEWLIDLLRNPGPHLQTLGYPGLMLIVFLETGAMVFFLPGDSLLVVAGLYAAKGDLSVVLLNLLLIPMAILGDATSYVIGKRVGPMLFDRPKSRFFRPEHVRAAHAFYERHGGKAIVLARFIPIVRTFVPVVAGIAGMTYRRFAAFNVVGGVAWVSSMTLLGYFLGREVPEIGSHIEKVILVVVAASFVPMVIGWWRARGARRAAAAHSPAGHAPAQDRDHAAPAAPLQAGAEDAGA
jgi:membrane-associated protein